MTSPYFSGNINQKLLPLSKSTVAVKACKWQRLRQDESDKYTLGTSINDCAFCLQQGCTNHWRQIARATKLFTVAPNVCGPSVLKLPLVTNLYPANVDFWVSS